MKDEFVGVIGIEFVGLKSKMYSMKNIDGKECNAAKGVSITTEFDKFKDVLFNEKIIRHKMKRIQSKKYELGTYEINKINRLCHVFTIKDMCLRGKKSLIRLCAFLCFLCARRKENRKKRKVPTI